MTIASQMVWLNANGTPEASLAVKFTQKSQVSMMGTAGAGGGDGGEGAGTGQTGQYVVFADSARETLQERGNPFIYSYRKGTSPNSVPYKAHFPGLAEPRHEGISLADHIFLAGMPPHR